MSLSRCRGPLTPPLPPLLGFLWLEQAPAGATVPPRSRRVCPKVRCVTRSWSPCKVERRIWVSAGSALPATILATRMCLLKWPSHIPSLLTNIPWLPTIRTTTNPAFTAPGIWPGPDSLPCLTHPLCSNCSALSSAPSCASPFSALQTQYMLPSLLQRPLLSLLT